jgi:hypothetical protein
VKQPAGGLNMSMVSIGTSSDTPNTTNKADPSVHSLLSGEGSMSGAGMRRITSVVRPLKARHSLCCQCHSTGCVAPAVIVSDCLAGTVADSLVSPDRHMVVGLCGPL